MRGVPKNAWRHNWLNLNKTEVIWKIVDIWPSDDEHWCERTNIDQKLTKKKKNIQWNMNILNNSRLNWKEMKNWKDCASDKAIFILFITKENSWNLCSSWNRKQNKIAWIVKANKFKRILNKTFNITKECILHNILEQNRNKEQYRNLFDEYEIIFLSVAFRFFLFIYFAGRKVRVMELNEAI